MQQYSAQRTAVDSSLAPVRTAAAFLLIEDTLVLLLILPWYCIIMLVVPGINSAHTGSEYVQVQRIYVPGTALTSRTYRILKYLHEASLSYCCTTAAAVL